MTEHVRNGYRKHAKTTWVAVVALVALVALAVALPALAVDRFGADDAGGCRADPGKRRRN